MFSHALKILPSRCKWNLASSFKADEIHLHLSRKEVCWDPNAKFPSYAFTKKVNESP